MTNKEAIMILESVQPSCEKYSYSESEIYEAIDMAIFALVAEPKWIPCSERLPEEGHDVLITKKPFELKGYEQYVIKAKRATDPRSGKIEWWSPEFGTLANKAVLAWMPLPEPYKGEQA